MAKNLKPRSRVITEGPDRAPARAMLKAAGFKRQVSQECFVQCPVAYLESVV